MAAMTFTTLAAASSSSRPTAPLPQHARQPTRNPYNPDIRELHPGPKNRLFLSLRSSIPSEVDWALPRLVLASFEQLDAFKLETWVDSVATLQEWPARWLEQLESEAALHLVRLGRVSPASKSVLAVIPEWTRDDLVESRSTNSLLVLRNASVKDSNAKLICRASFVAWLDRFFSLPTGFLVDLSLRAPEPVSHILVILQSIFPFLHPSPRIFRIFSTVLPSLVVESRDLGMMVILLPLLISGMTLANLPLPPETLIPHLLNLLTLSPPSQLLDHTLDLLISLTLQPLHARRILAWPAFPVHLRNLVLLLEHQAKNLQASWDPPANLQGVTVNNPAGAAWAAEQATKRRAVEREAAQRQLEVYGGMGLVIPVGDKPPMLSTVMKTRLYKMKEPARSIAWMHETFVYCTTSQLLQVTFWHAYRDFFQHPSTVEPLLSASEVIKNVTIAFPGASAKVWVDERGDQKFVIAGMGFRRGADDDDRFTCLWRGCLLPLGSNSPSQLLTHIQSSHLSPIPHQCSWGTCTHPFFTPSHLLTHLPLQIPHRVTESITLHPQSPERHLKDPLITSRPPPPVPKSLKLHFTGSFTPTDKSRNPIGVAFLSALVIRNLARTLRSEVNSALSVRGTVHGDVGSPAMASMTADGSTLTTQQLQEAKKRQLMEERFGLPIPDSVLKEEEEEEKRDRTAGAGADRGMSEEERARAVSGFERVEERVVDVVVRNMSGVSQFLGDAFGW